MSGNDPGAVASGSASGTAASGSGGAQAPPAAAAGFDPGVILEQLRQLGEQVATLKAENDELRRGQPTRDGYYVPADIDNPYLRAQHRPRREGDRPQLLDLRGEIVHDGLLSNTGNFTNKNEDHTTVQSIATYLYDVIKFWDEHLYEQLGGAEDEQAYAFNNSLVGVLKLTDTRAKVIQYGVTRKDDTALLAALKKRVYQPIPNGTAHFVDVDELVAAHDEKFSVEVIAQSAKAAARTATGSGFSGGGASDSSAGKNRDQGGAAAGRGKGGGGKNK
jgi:hypothetical protein